MTTTRERPRVSALGAQWILVVGALLGSSCGIARSVDDASADAESRDAATDSGIDGTSVDSSVDALVDRDASGLSCYPLVVSGVTWHLGDDRGCQLVGFFVSASELAAAAALTGVTCNSTMPYECFLWAKPLGPVTRPEYEDLCRIEDALGPRLWDCQTD